MELDLLTSCFLYAAIAWISTFYILTTIKRSKFNHKRQPPGPFPLPIVGNIFSLGTEPHKGLTQLAKKYGPIMCLQLGFQNTVVITSTAMAKEVLQTSDVSFANRHVPDCLTALDHQESSLALRPADARWKEYRKICISHVFANSRLDATQSLRKKKVEELISFVQTCSETGKPVNIGQAAFTTSLNFLSNTFFSIDLGDPNSEISREFKTLANTIIVEAGTPNFADFFPMLKPLDPQGIKKRTAIAFEKIMAIFDRMITERLEVQKLSSSSTKKNDILEALLTLTKKSTELQLPEIPHLMLDLFVGGIDTTTGSLEWAMAELMRNPSKMKRAQSELEQVIGRGNLVEEEDASRLPYLKAVVKETLRVHAPIPFLIPRRVYEDTPLSDYTVPKNTQILVNVYAIQRDPTLWENPESFEPERFLGSSIDYKGQNFELLPFGSGRRMCPGIPLANKMLHWMLGSLIHSFDWKLEDGVTPNTLDMEEQLGFILHKAKPLLAVPMVKQ